ncbi:toxin glutamine deamidase domain-containing protein [Micromonospora sp. NPDC003197]
MDNWQILDLTSDPIPGSPDQIRAVAAQLRRRAASADRYANRLRVISSNSGLLKLQGNFAAIYRDSLASLPAEASKISPAYSACADILSAFANLMDQAKASARTALSQGMQADAQYRSLLAQFYALTSGVSSAGGIWRGLNESSALALTAGRDVAVREFARRIGYNAGLCEQQRQNLRRFVLQLAHAHHQAGIRCAALIRAVAPAVRSLRKGPVTQGRGPKSTTVGSAPLVPMGLAGDVAGRRWWENPGTTLRGSGYFTPRTPGLVELINPGGGRMNCRACVVAVDATLSGAPTSAIPNIPAGPISVLEQHFGAKFRHVKLSGLVEEMTKAGHGARGIVYGYGGGPVGHVFNVMNDNGKIVFLDGQSGIVDHVARWRHHQLMRTN